MVSDMRKKLKERDIAKESKRLVEKMSLEQVGDADPETGMVQIQGELLGELVLLAVDVAMHFNEEL